MRAALGRGRRELGVERRDASKKARWEEGGRREKGRERRWKG